MALIKAYHAEERVGSFAFMKEGRPRSLSSVSNVRPVTQSSSNENGHLIGFDSVRYI
jgi:hypothetical protein